MKPLSSTRALPLPDLLAGLLYAFLFVFRQKENNFDVYVFFVWLFTESGAIGLHHQIDHGHESISFSTSTGDDSKKRFIFLTS